jgi:hypothetical protein
MEDDGSRTAKKMPLPVQRRERQFFSPIAIYLEKLAMAAASVG